jgi:biopolymer transport protein ExbB/TolQ
MNIFKIIELSASILLPLFIVSIASGALIIELTIFNLKTHNAIKNKTKENKLISILSLNTSKEIKINKINFEIQKAERRTSILSIVASIAPMVGLLGTVFGMIKIFNQVSVQKPTNPLEALSGGISEALFATAGGLIVAIVTGFFHHFLTMSLDSIDDKIFALLDE